MIFASAEILCAYTAGFVDGEGSIQINPARASAKSKVAYWNASVHVAQNDRSILDALAEVWDIGTVNTYDGRGVRVRSNSRWSIYGREVDFLLPRILPYLQVKRRHAEIIIAFRQLVGYKRGRLDAAGATARTALALELRELNAKHSKALPTALRMAR